MSPRDPRSLLLGWDGSHGKWFAQLYDPGATADDSPVAVMGYSHEELLLAWGSENQGSIDPGPARIETLDELRALCEQRWGWSFTR